MKRRSGARRIQLLSLLSTCFLLYDLPVAVAVSEDTNAYVLGVHVTRNAQYDSVTKMYSAVGCSFAGQLAPMYIEEYFAIVDGHPVYAEYVTKNTVERVPSLPTSLCPFVLRPVREATLILFGSKKKYKYSSAKGGKWTVENLVTLPVATFAIDGFASMAAAKGHTFKPVGWDKVAGVRCQTSMMDVGGAKIATCIADEKELKKSGVTFPRQLGMSYVYAYKDGTDTKKVEQIDFKAKIPLSVLFPPQSVADTPRKAYANSAHSRWCAAEKKRTGKDPCVENDE